MSKGTDPTQASAPGLASGLRINTSLEKDLEPGTLVHEYIVDKKIGEGGSALVYLVHHQTTGVQAALKVLRAEYADNTELVMRFMREIKVVNQLSHPNTVRLLHYGFSDQFRPFFIMELVEGQTLRHIIKKRGRFSLEEARPILEAVCSALSRAHKEGIVHRDVKTANVMVTASGEVKLLDFGIAKLLRPEPDEVGLTTTAHRLGTSTSMAPEQINGEPADVRTDIYALGVLVFEVLTGGLPFVAKTQFELEHLHLNAQPPLPSQRAPLSQTIDSMILRCLAKERASRFESVDQFLATFQACCTEQEGPKARAEVAVAVHAAFTQDTEDDEFWELLPSWLDPLEAKLAESGFSPVLQTASAVLYVKSSSEQTAQTDLQSTQALAEALKELGAEALNHEGVHFKVRVKLGTVESRGATIEGGTLLKLDDW